MISGHRLKMLAAFAFLEVGMGQDPSNTFAFCGDCWCIPDGENATCPVDEIPKTAYSQAFIDNLMGVRLENPISLGCDPYDDDNCDTVPPLAAGAVCAFELINHNDQCPDDFSYRLRTVASADETETQGLYVTHLGACGVCSTLQDLAVYITLPDLAEAGTQCAIRSLANEADGLQCYKDIGFSEGCAAIWLYNTRNTRNLCLSFCLEHSQSSAANNLPAPSCELVQCIQCDEENSGPLFRRFAGRTRRGSGVLSQIARPCSTVARIAHVDPCEADVPAHNGNPAIENASDVGRGFVHSLSTLLLIGLYFSLA